MPVRSADIAVVGAGIVGLAHALEAARRGHRVVLFERNPRALGASIRNFGLVWPVGQEAGAMHQRALQSRAAWLELAGTAGIWHRLAGSLHLAHAPDELQILDEFAQLAPVYGCDCTLIDAREARRLSPALRPEKLLGALWSPTEVVIDPRQATDRLAAYLETEYGVELHFSTPVSAIDLPNIHTPAGTLKVERALVCSGADFTTLYPAHFDRHRLTHCKLQMMRTAPQPDGWQLGPMLANGLTLRRYAAFAHCPTTPAYKARIAAEQPELDQYGIHILVAQNETGELIIGDSHEYGVPEPFDRPQIDQLILNQLRTFLAPPSLEITQRWHGIYAVHGEQHEFVADPAPGVRIVNGLAGAGMSTSFGLAAEVFDAWG